MPTRITSWQLSTSLKATQLRQKNSYCLFSPYLISLVLYFVIFLAFSLIVTLLLLVYCLFLCIIKYSCSVGKRILLNSILYFPLFCYKSVSFHIHSFRFSTSFGYKLLDAVFKQPASQNTSYTSLIHATV